jgi:hypothetical protein
VQGFHRIPTNQTSSTNFPSEENSYINPAYWHRTAPLWINSLEPVGESPPRHRRPAELTMPPPRTDVWGGGFCGGACGNIEGAQDRRERQFSVPQTNEKMSFRAQSTVRRSGRNDPGRWGRKAEGVAATVTPRTGSSGRFAPGDPGDSFGCAQDKLFGSGLRPPLGMTSSVGGGNRSSGPRRARASFASGASRSGGYKTLPYGAGSAQAHQADRRC